MSWTAEQLDVLRPWMREKMPHTELRQISRHIAKHPQAVRRHWRKVSLALAMLEGRIDDSAAIPDGVPQSEWGVARSIVVVARGGTHDDIRDQLGFTPLGSRVAFLLVYDSAQFVKSCAHGAPAPTCKPAPATGWKFTDGRLVRGHDDVTYDPHREAFEARHRGNVIGHYMDVPLAVAALDREQKQHAADAQMALFAASQEATE